MSGHGRLALEHDVPVSVHSLAEAEYPCDQIAEGDEIVVGDVTLRVIHTPGHRPEHCCFAVVDRTRADEPWLLLTGDSLFVGDAARPDLAIEAHEGAEGLFHSLHRLLELPDGVEVYPGHVAGSLCGKSMSSKASTTIGFERRFNRALALATVEAFVADSARSARPVRRTWSASSSSTAGRSSARRRRWRSWSTRATPPCSTYAPCGDLLRGPCSRRDQRARLGHELREQERHSSCTPHAPLVLHASTPEEALEGARGLRSVGFLEILGYVLSPPAEASIDPVEIDELDALLAYDAQLIDVREADEREEAPLPGSRHIPYRLVEAAANDLPADRTIVTICETGARAAVAASILAARGLDARPVAHGGFRDLRDRLHAAV